MAQSSLPDLTFVDLPPPLSADEAPFLASPEVGDGSFRNPWAVHRPRRVSEVLKWKLGTKNPFAAEKRSRAPKLPRADHPVDLFDDLPPGARVQWLGHASVLVELDGVHILIDPLFGRAGGTMPRLAPAPRAVDGLPRIDAVLVSHGHYDHLDRASLAAVARCWPEAIFAVPLGQERSLPRVCQRVVRLSWWQSLTVRGVQLTLTPAQHWHRRGPFDQDRALWGGWHLRGSRSVFHSGDTGYFEGFSTISRVLGAPDIAVLPLGAYEPRWFMAEQHMSPEDSLQAFVDLGARAFLGMHWGTFDLTDEPADHGAFTLLPEIAAARGLSRDRLHVLSHGGALGFGGEVEARGAVSVA